MMRPIRVWVCALAYAVNASGPSEVDEFSQAQITLTLLRG
jgi:hypothetical protein